MNITDIRIRKIYEDARLKALVSVTIDGDLAVHDIKVIEGPERLLWRCPAARMRMGHSVILPTPSRRRRGIHWRRQILDRYQTHLAQLEAEQTATPHIPA